MLTGIVKKKNEKGFGFITPDGETQDLFFHKNDLVGVTFEELNEGDRVTFDKAQTDKGWNATGVKRA